MPDQNRQLAAILFTDIVGYTAMLQQDEGREKINIHNIKIKKPLKSNSFFSTAVN
jgi:hypothetical protein